jgi:hypothetical protein
MASSGAAQGNVMEACKACRLPTLSVAGCKSATGLFKLGDIGAQENAPEASFDPTSR